MLGILRVYFVLNSVQLAAVMAVFRNCSPWQTYRTKVAPLWLVDSSLFLLGILCAVLWRYHPLSLIF